MPLNLFYTMVQKSQKWPKTQIKGGGGPGFRVAHSSYRVDKVIALQSIFFLLSQVGSDWLKSSLPLFWQAGLSQTISSLVEQHIVEQEPVSFSSFLLCMVQTVQAASRCGVCRLHGSDPQFVSTG